MCRTVWSEKADGRHVPVAARRCIRTCGCTTPRLRPAKKPMRPPNHTTSAFQKLSRLFFASAHIRPRTAVLSTLPQGQGSPGFPPPQAMAAPASPPPPGPLPAVGRARPELGLATTGLPAAPNARPSPCRSGGRGRPHLRVRARGPPPPPPPPGPHL